MQSNTKRVGQKLTKDTKEKIALYKEMKTLKFRWEMMPQNTPDEIGRKNKICQRLDEMFIKWSKMK